jgi:hypothetical protein
MQLLKDATDSAPEFFGFRRRSTTNLFMHRTVTLARKESAHRRETKIVRRQNNNKIKREQAHGNKLT